jgi:LPS O-antigen subunit length determinant protein (WzzB/FepE family)
MSIKESKNYYQKDELTLKQILIFFYRGKWFFILFLTLVAISTYSYIKTITPSYEASIQYRIPSDLATSQINTAKFGDAAMIPGSEKKLEKKEIFDMFFNKVFSQSFKEHVFRKNGYLERISNKGTDEIAVIYSFLDRVKLNKNLSSDISSYHYMRGSDPEILTDFLNDLLFEAKNSLLKDLKQIEMNLIQKQIKIISSEINRLEQIQKDKLNEQISFLKTELLTAKLAKIDNTDFEKVALIFENAGLSDLMISNKRLSSVFPLWYLYGEDFIEFELEKLITNGESKNYNLISFYADRDSLESFEMNIDNVEVIDITWSITPTSPYEPKKKLIMVIILTIAFLFAIFLWYVLELFRSSK